MPYSQSGWRESVDSQEETKIGYIHEQFDNYCFLPRIENMKVAEYVVNINIVNRICTVKNKVRFIPTPQARNYSEDTRSESKFIYPIHNGASVCKFEAELYSKENTLVHRIKAKITEREQASQIFQQSKDEDKAAVMGTLDNTAADSFIIELGQIGPDQSVAVNFEYFMDLKVEEGGKHRHQSTDSRSRLMKLHLPMSHKKRFVVGERVPQHNLHENIYDSTFVTKVYLTCEPPAKRVFGKIMDSTGKIVERKISKHVHEELKLERWALNSEELKVCPVDIEIFIENSIGKDFSIGNMTDAFECNKKEAIYVTHIKPKKLIPDNFIPEFLKKEEKMKEYIFLIDRSGSMSGSLMKQAKHCLMQAIQQLPRKCKFNIVSFGSRFSKLWDVAQPYTSQNITEAKMHIDEMVANLGGTELLKPLEEIFNCYLDPKVEVRDIILLTDGSVSNTEEVLEFCARNKEKNRIFTVGIGSGASTCLVDGVAKNTRGQSIYVNLNDRMTQKVLQLARYTTEPVLVLIDVNFPSLPPQCVPSGPGIKGDEVYIYEETRLFFRIKKINEGFLKKYEGQNIRVEMTFKIGDQDAEYIHEFPISPVPSNENTSLMSYWAKQEIQKLEVLRRSIGFQGEHAEVKDRIIELSKEGNILHAYTAFIGVSERGNAPKAGSDPSASFHLTNSALESLHNYSG